MHIFLTDSKILTTVYSLGLSANVFLYGIYQKRKENPYKIR